MPLLARWHAWTRAHPYLYLVVGLVLYPAVGVGCLFLSRSLFPSFPVYVSLAIVAVGLHALHWASIQSWRGWLQRAILHVAGQARPARSADVIRQIPAPAKDVRNEIDWLLANGRLTTDPGSGRLVAAPLSPSGSA